MTWIIDVGSQIYMLFIKCQCMIQILIFGVQLMQGFADTPPPPPNKAVNSRWQIDSITFLWSSDWWRQLIWAFYARFCNSTNCEQFCGCISWGFWWLSHKLSFMGSVITHFKLLWCICVGEWKQYKLIIVRYLEELKRKY